MVDFYASCAVSLAPFLVTELQSLGATRVQLAGAGVRFEGTLETAYRACLESHVADRVLYPIHSGTADNEEALYRVVQEVDWSEHLDCEGTLLVDFFSARSQLTHTRYGAQKVKDAVVDQFRDSVGRRPSVERRTPDVRINAYVYRDKLRLAIDLSGGGLHRRAYRHAASAERHLAPLKENLAAGLLRACDWPGLLEQGRPFCDPMCGSGTLVIEAALMARRQAPGLLREHFGFLGWKGHQDAIWQQVRNAAEGRIRPSPVPLYASDIDDAALAQTRASLALLGAEDDVAIERVDARQASAVQGVVDAGLLLSNVPYGHRLSNRQFARDDIALALSQHYAGWHYGLLMPQAEGDDNQPRAGQGFALPVHSRLDVMNGGIPCQLLMGEVPGARANNGGLAQSQQSPAVAGSAQPPASDDSAAANPPLSTVESDNVDVSGFANRLKKNLKRLGRWQKQHGIAAYRVYDADLPEFALAVDIYDTNDAGRQVVVQEYRAPKSVNLAVASARRAAAMAAIPAILDIEADKLHFKERQKQKGGEQYARRSTVGHDFRHGHRNSATVLLEEQGCRFLLNFTDYLDTGLFLDHRKLRHHLQAIARGKRFLNLFAYTGSLSVAAGVGGAESTLSVDLSNTYCQWAVDNLALNGLGEHNGHRVERADVLTWLKEAETTMAASQDLIVLDPPTFSNSQRTDDDWSVQDHHQHAIRSALTLLAPGGTLIFSCNYRRFKLDPEVTAGLDGLVRVEDKSRWSIDQDFQRNQRIHYCWFLHRN